MGTKQGDQAPRLSRARITRERKYQHPQTIADHNAARRELYANDPEYAERARTYVRRAYRAMNPPRPKIPDGQLRVKGVQREVEWEGEDSEPQMIESFTIPEAAAALGRTELTFRRWLNKGLIPDPVLFDTTRRYRLYSRGELQTVAKILAEHERSYTYYSEQNEDTRLRIEQAVEGYRRQYI
jgi:hypothetical protein